MKHKATLENFLSTELTQEIKNLIVTCYEGEYELFTKYKITQFKNYYLVTTRFHDEVQEFTSIKNAVAWCTLTNAGHYCNAKKIKELDLKLTGLAVDIMVHKNLSKHTKVDPETKWLHIVKMQEGLRKKHLVTLELSRLVAKSARVQQQIFSSKQTNKK